ncbi:MAG: DegT/DnrJ/EryC1/StrS family aminotransferase [Ignavibacteriae bacterium]|nr:DegT/DnrJ/EryC1/StrS family aminotransferase [Ignavibacteriota bacterium]
MPVISNKKYCTSPNIELFQFQNLDEKRNQFIPFGKPNFSEEEINAVSNVLRSGWIGMGNETLSFENELADYIQTSNVLSVNSCTSALFLSLLVSGVSKDDEVIVPSLTWCSTANAALYLNAKPVFADINKENLSLDISSIKKRITNKTKAIIVVHYGGYGVDVDSLRKEIPQNIAIIEDAAHALGARYPNGKMVGSSENLICFSFYANKNLSTGEGGAIAFKNDNIVSRLSSLRQHGMNNNAWSRYIKPEPTLYAKFSELGYKMNFTDLQASIGRVQLQRFEEMQNHRKIISEYYYKELETLQPEIKFQNKMLSSDHARHLFPILLPTEHLSISRDDFLIKLREKNIGASLHYKPLHINPLYDFGSSLPVTEEIANSIMTLPISASISLSDAKYIVHNFKKIFNNNLD